MSTCLQTCRRLLQHWLQRLPAAAPKVSAPVVPKATKFDVKEFERSGRIVPLDNQEPERSPNPLLKVTTFVFSRYADAADLTYQGLLFTHYTSCLFQGNIMTIQYTLHERKQNNVNNTARFF